MLQETQRKWKHPLGAIILGLSGLAYVLSISAAYDRDLCFKFATVMHI